MNKLDINSVMLDTSFCIRLMDQADPLHQNALDYYKYFLTEKISLHVSTIVIAEYAVGDDPANLPLNNLQIETFDFLDAIAAGQFHKEIKGNSHNIPEYNRRIIANDVKIFAQIKTKNIDAIISKDVNSIKQYHTPLTNLNLVNFKFIDLTTPLNLTLGQLFV
jgi:predicted nucleic acid-binding protein